MPAKRTVFLCTSCGDTTPRWQGRCPNCGEWNTLVEETVSRKSSRSLKDRAGTVVPRRLSEIPADGAVLAPSGLNEFDRVLGGGVPPAASILIAGEPGVGKSTLMLQVAASVPGKPVLYVTTEESAAAVARRARRISPSSDVFILAENNVAAILDASRKACARTLIVDSLQMLLPESGAPPGTPAGVREAAALLGDYAHQSPGAAVFMVGHITKTGFIAGPKLVEHMVDVVLYFETEGNLALRLLRARKNRFASTESVGVFAMAESGLAGVEDPSGFFLEEERERLSGTAPAAALVGDRVLFLDVQALVSAVPGDRPGARRVSGLDANRVSMILAVLEKRLGMNLCSKDVFLNVAGGVKIIEPASDLAVAAAVMSSVADLPFPHRSVFIGEVGLGGEVRRVPMLPLRVKEAARMGFKRIAVPGANHKELRTAPSVQVVFVDNVAELRKMLSEA